MSNPLKAFDLERLPPDLRVAFEAEIASRLKAEAQARDLQRAADEREDAIKRFEHLVKELRHALYGKKSEKLAVDHRQLCFEDLEVAVAEAEEQQARLKQDDAPRKKASKPNLANRVDQETEDAVIKNATDFPAYGQARTSNELRKWGYLSRPLACGRSGCGITWQTSKTG